MSTPSSRFPNRFVLAFIIFLALILVGTSGIHWLEGMSLVDALYMTVITVSTVGFGKVREIQRRREPHHDALPHQRQAQRHYAGAS